MFSLSCLQTVTGLQCDWASPASSYCWWLVLLQPAGDREQQQQVPTGTLRTSPGLRLASASSANRWEARVPPLITFSFSQGITERVLPGCITACYGGFTTSFSKTRKRRTSPPSLVDNIFNVRLAPATLHAPFSASGLWGGGTEAFGQDCWTASSTRLSEGWALSITPPLWL